ncbi:hypothetical protein GUITHDRAFT_161678 [Guillardia theta CCMP2712]|uniref:Uncharacterized protein n=2 Tax=Guillardia theta TaxID=55529 RepID=L1JTD8_GUITC|nr:hypothetical protein GUITHDRAFT_161678 [Guillardia theta CCMP2712]EKX51333.1 hypothetical protein GUITHDRAFT_161678 [Guillardia theta CCMP2712]|eukprot:XP_005838313.1 hypothetical protein GUITHDRAFT_161678 [Guillardia theta CCMP2712]
MLHGLEIRFSGSSQLESFFDESSWELTADTSMPKQGSSITCTGAVTLGAYKAHSGGWMWKKIFGS